MSIPVAHNTRSRTANNMDTIKFEPFVPNVDDAGLWLRNFERFAKLKSRSDDQFTSAFPLYLRQIATLLYDAVPEATQKNITNIKKLFLDRFIPTSVNRWKEMETFLNKKQGEAQSVEEFCEEVHRLADQLGKDEESVKDVIIRGLRPSLRQFVLTRDHSSLTNVTNARLAQSLSTTNDPALTSIETNSCIFS